MIFQIQPGEDLVLFFLKKDDGLFLDSQLAEPLRILTNLYT